MNALSCAGGCGFQGCWYCGVSATNVPSGTTDCPWTVEAGTWTFGKQLIGSDYWDLLTTSSSNASLKLNRSLPVLPFVVSWQFATGTSSPGTHEIEIGNHRIRLQLVANHSDCRVLSLWQISPEVLLDEVHLTEAANTGSNYLETEIYFGHDFGGGSGQEIVVASGNLAIMRVAADCSTATELRLKTGTLTGSRGVRFRLGRDDAAPCLPAPSNGCLHRTWPEHLDPYDARSGAWAAGSDFTTVFYTVKTIKSEDTDAILVAPHHVLGNNQMARVFCFPVDQTGSVNATERFAPRVFALNDNGDGVYVEWDTDHRKVKVGTVAAGVCTAVVCAELRYKPDSTIDWWRAAILWLDIRNGKAIGGVCFSYREFGASLDSTPSAYASIDFDPTADFYRWGIGTGGAPAKFGVGSGLFCHSALCDTVGRRKPSVATHGVRLDSPFCQFPVTTNPLWGGFQYDTLSPRVKVVIAGITSASWPGNGCATDPSLYNGTYYLRQSLFGADLFFDSSDYHFGARQGSYTGIGAVEIEFYGEFTCPSTANTFAIALASKANGATRDWYVLMSYAGTLWKWHVNRPTLQENGTTFATMNMTSLEAAPFDASIVTVDPDGGTC